MKNVIKVLLIASLIGGVVYYFYKGNKLDGQGVLTIAKFSHIVKGGKNAPIFFYNFQFRGVEYITSYRDLSIIDTYKYCRFTPDDPTFNEILSDERVPPCLRPENVPINGWKKLPPPDTCNR